MSADLVINLDGLRPVKRMLGQLERLPLGELLEVIGSEVEGQTRRRFEERTDPEGVPWAPWSEDYAARRPNRGGILELSGALRDSLTYEVSGDTVIVGSNMVYASTHNEGDEDRNIPERQFIGLSEENLNDVGVEVIAFFARRARS